MTQSTLALSLMDKVEPVTNYNEILELVRLDMEEILSSLIY